MLKKTFALFLIFILSVTSKAQDIEIKQAKNPYNKSLQWGNKGTLLISEEPRGTTFKRTLHFITAEGESSWQKEFLPKVKDPIPVFDDNSKYIYFFDKVEDLDQTITFTQFGPSGVSTPKAIKFRVELRSQLGNWVNSSLFNLEQIVTLSEDLVFVFSYFNKDKDATMYAVMRLDHNSLRPECVFAPEFNSSDNIKNGLTGHVQCIGEVNGQILFSRNVMKKDEKSNQVYFLDQKNNWKQKYLKYVPSYVPYPSNAQLKQYGYINNYKSGNNSKKKLDYRSNANNILIHNNLLVNYAFTSKSSKNRESVRVFVQDITGTIVWDKNILFSEYLQDDVITSKGKPEDLFLDAFVAEGKLQIVIKGDKSTRFEMDLKNGNFKKHAVDINETQFTKNPYQLFYGPLVESEKLIEISLNDGIYQLNPTEIEKGHLFLKKK